MKCLVQIATVSIFAALACTGLRAQSVALQAEIPFNFQAGHKLMPAGEYEIQEDGAVLVLRGSDHGQPVVALITFCKRAANPSSRNRLEFDRYGNEYYLTAVWDAVTQDGRQIPQTARQKELASRGNPPVRATVALAHIR